MDGCRARGLRVALATNSVFPRIAIEERMRWGALDPARFDFVATFEGMRACKPSSRYYREVAATLGVEPTECLMVGNDLEMDIAPAKKAGMATFLVDNAFVIKNADVSPDHTGPLRDVPQIARPSPA